MVGRFGGPYTFWSGGVAATVTNPCAGGLGSEIKAVPIADNSALEASGLTYQVCGLPSTVDAEYASSGNDFLLQIDLGPAQILRISGLETTPISTATQDWIFETPSAGCVKRFRMLDTGEIGKTVQCPKDVTSDTLTFESRPADGPVSQSYTEAVRPLAIAGPALANWAGTGTSYYFEDSTPSRRDLILVDPANGTRSTATPFPGCYDVLDAGNVLWNGDRTCAL